MEQVERLAQRHKLRSRARQFLAIPHRVGLLVAYVSSIALLWFFVLEEWNWLALWIAGLLSLVIADQTTFLLWHRSTKRLMEANDLRLVGLIVDTFEVAPTPPFGVKAEASGIHRIAADALVRMLPNITAANAGLLSAGQRRTLIRILRGDVPCEFKDAGLDTVILQSLAHFGDRRDLAVVEAVAGARGRPTAVRNAAEVAAAAIRRRLVDRRARTELLRAADSAAQESILLKAAQGRTQGQEETLLRPGG